MEIEGRSSTQLFLGDHSASGLETGMYPDTTCIYMSRRDKVYRGSSSLLMYDWKEPLVFLLAPAGPGLCAATSRMDLGAVS